MLMLPGTAEYERYTIQVQFPEYLPPSEAFDPSAEGNSVASGQNTMGTGGIITQGI